MNAKSFGIGAALFAAQTMITLPALAEDRGPAAPEFIWHDIEGITWRFCGNARIVGDELVCEADASNRYAYAVGSCDLSEYDGKPMQMQIVASSEDVTKSEKGYLGFRFLLSYLDMEMGGQRVWPNGGRLDGTQPPTEIIWRDVNPKRRGECTVQLGLHDCTGRAVFNLRTLQARATSPLVPKINAGYKVKYPDYVKNAPRGRGVMLGGMNEEAWDELKSWGVNLVRHQIGLRGTGPATNHAEYTRGYLENFDKRLDELEKNLAAARARGIRVCIDQHSSPGGVCDAGDPAEWSGDSRIFHDPFYAQLFIDCWVKLVRRMAPYRDAIYGYDLINEAHHNSPALPGGDIVGLQERCAKAIREVDPDTPIIVESMYCDPGWFRSLSAIDLGNIIYSVHVYTPHDYTHQGILTPPERVENWPDPKKGWNRDFLRRQLKPVLDFQKEHDAKIFVGEFSAISWAPNAEGYIRDCITLFEEFGWDWTYHAYREYEGWSVQYEPLSRIKGPGQFRKSESNPRMDVLKEGLAGGFAPKAEENHAREGDVSSRAKPDFKTLIAHRGECFDAPENTLPAFEIAVEHGFGFEFDVQLSSDGRVFTMHDLNLKRTAGIDLDCAKASWEDVISKIDFGVGKWDKWKGTRPALLEEVLPLARDGRYLCVEIKAGPAIVPYIKRIVEAQDKANSGNLLFISFYESSLQAVKREMPGYKTILAQVEISAEAAVEKCRKFGFDGLTVRYDEQRITEEYVRTIHDAGLELHVWTIDTVESAITALSRGVDFVLTNFAKRLKDAFDAKGTL